MSGVRAPFAHLVGDQGVTHDADTVRVGQADRRGQQPGLADPLQAGQLAVSVEPMRARKQRLLPDHTGGHDHRHARAHRTRAAAQGTIALDQGDVADPDARHVGDRVERPGHAGADHYAMVAGAGAEHASDDTSWDPKGAGATLAPGRGLMGCKFTTGSRVR